MQPSERPWKFLKKFQSHPEQLEAATDKTKLIMYSSPNNPTGTVYSEAYGHCRCSREERTRVRNGRWNLRIHQLLKEGHFSIGSIDAIKDRVINVNGMAKGFPWPVGELVISEQPNGRRWRNQIQATSNIRTNHIAQRASVVAWDDMSARRSECVERTWPVGTNGNRP
jgi:aspartate aminotransferase